MGLEPEAILRVQARAFNAHDLETLVGHYTTAARFIRDGEWLGEGHDAVRKGFEDEFRGGQVVGRVTELDGEPVLVEWAGEEGHQEPRGVIRIAVDGSRVTECRVDHDPDLVARLRATASGRAADP